VVTHIQRKSDGFPAIFLDLGADLLPFGFLIAVSENDIVATNGEYV
jgi:hypothetical protein